jgi:tetratricopeptide (TPR) repeat protein
VGSIFLSYARQDAAKAKRIAQALEQAGHSVWWDRQLQPGERFSAEIDKELKSADAVVVLWSGASIQSAWVLDEAGVGRDSDRLVPALLEPVMPPLGFRQYHAVDLSRGRLSARSAAPLVEAVDARVSGKRAETKPQMRSMPLLQRRTLIALVAFVFLIAGAGAWWLLRPEALTSSPSIIVEPADANSPMAEIIARSIGDELGRFRTGPLAVLDIKRGKEKSATYHGKVSFVESPNKVSLELSLASGRIGNLWSTIVEGPPNQGSELNRQAAAMLGAALQCDLNLDKRRDELKADVRALYVDGCARLADPGASRNQAINAFRQVTQKAPRFAPGWAHLAYAEFTGIDFVPGSEQSNLAWTAGRHVMTAQSLEPNLPEYFYVRALDQPWTATTASEALKVLDDGVHLNPDSALLHSARADMLLRLGQVSQGLESAKRAVDLNPLSPALLETYVLALEYAGQPSAAERELKAAESNWRRSAAIAALRFKFDLRYGDAANALRMLKNNEVPDVTPNESMELFLQARAEPSAANIEAALQSYRAALLKSNWSVLNYVQALGEFQKVDEAYHALASTPAEPWYSNGDIFFRPFMRAIRADPRFMQIAYRTGLLSFWRKGGDWPDFCRDPKLPYDCRNEAAKYPLEPPRT